MKKNNNILKIDNIYIGTLIASNVLEIFNATSEYANCQYNIVKEYSSKYSDINKENVVSYREKIKNNTTEKK